MNGKKLQPLPTSSFTEKKANLTVTYFPPEVILLGVELVFHPEILKVVAGTGGDWVRQVLTAASQVGILVEGKYGEEDFRRIALAVVDELKKRRGFFILDTSGRVM